MRHTATLVATLVVALGVLAAPAVADEGELPEHGHMLLQRPGWTVDVGEEFVTITLTFRRCVDLAGGRALPLHAHHATVHTGSASHALWEIAGHGVIPTGISPWDDCADLIANPSFQFPFDEL